MTCLYADTQPLQQIDIKPLEAVCAALCRLITTMDVLLNGGRKALRMSKQLARAVQQLIQTEEHNGRVKTKAEMLMNANWRARVLRDLGGEKALERWERLSGRWRNSKDILKPPDASPAQRRARAANLEKAKAANRNKLFKFGPTRKAGNDYHLNTVLDRAQVDMEGQFRLAPITRQKIKIKAQDTPNPQTPKTHIKSITYTKINPIPLWPIEFRAAASSVVIPHKTRSVADAGPSSAPHGQSASKACGQPPGQTTYRSPNEPPLVPGQARDDIERNGSRKDDAHDPP
jgi:hypothetical protein